MLTVNIIQRIVNVNVPCWSSPREEGLSAKGLLSGSSIDLERPEKASSNNLMMIIIIIIII